MQIIAHNKIVADLRSELFDKSTELKIAKEANTKLNNRLIQLESMDKRMAEYMASKKEDDWYIKELAQAQTKCSMWKHRAYKLAENINQNEAHRYSPEVLGLLAKMDVLPDGLGTTRLAKRNQKRLTKHLKVIDSTIKEVEGIGLNLNVANS